MKTFSKILYAAYSLFVILMLVFGNDAVSTAIDFVKEQLTKKIEIADVGVHLQETELLAGRYYYPEYTPIGDFDGDAGFIYASMNPDYLVVSDNGAICANKNFEGESIEASVKITSKYDKNFEKIVTYRFVKKYPDVFNVRYFIKGHSFDTSTLYVGVPVYVYSNISSASSPYNCVDHKIIYDEDCFEIAKDGALIPKRVTMNGETLNFVVMYENGVSAVSQSFEIKEPEYQLLEVDEIKINGLVGDTIESTQGIPLVITLYNHGELVASDYSLELEDENDVSMSLSGNCIFKTAGDKKLTIILPNGFSKTFIIKIRNIMSAPVFQNESFQQSHQITMMDTETKTLSFTFPSGVTYTTIKYEFDKEMIEIEPESRSFVIVPKKDGVTTVKLILDDGVSRIEESYIVEITKDTSIRATLSNTANYWVPKFFGHGGLFAVLAFFAMNMFKYVDIRNVFGRFCCYLLSGLSIALISEIVQIFIPSRSGRIIDILLDMGGFLLGTLIVLLFRSRKKNDSQEGVL